MYAIKNWKSFAYIALCLFMAVILCSCSGKNNSTISSASADSNTSVSVTASQETTQEATDKNVELNAEAAKAVLKDFLNADSIHMKALVTYKTYESSPVDPKTFELWIKGLNYRSDEYQDSFIRFIIIVKEKDAKQYSMSSKNILSPLSPPDNYTDYYKWDFTKIDDGTVSSDGEYVVFTIDGIDRFYKKEGAQAGYYYTKVEFGIDNDTVLYTTIYGNSSYGEKPSNVNAVTQTYEFVNVNESFTDSVFDAPF